MRILSFLFFLWTAMACHGESPEPQLPSDCRKSDSPWLGLQVVLLEEATAAQLNDVPKGFGLLVKSVASASPASEAGLQSLDVIWKFDEQLIANKGQLLALIQLTGVGNQGVVTISRAGERLMLPLTIGLRMEDSEKLAEVATEVLLPPLAGSIVRQVNLGNRSGFISEGGVTVSLSRKSEGAQYQIISNGEMVEEGIVEEDVESWPATLDQKTRRKLAVLFQSLKNAEQREAVTGSIPRVRRVRGLPKGAEK